VTGLTAKSQFGTCTTVLALPHPDNVRKHRGKAVQIAELSEGKARRKGREKGRKGKWGKWMCVRGTGDEDGEGT
jgi:hypothetical protein